MKATGFIDMLGIRTSVYTEAALSAVLSYAAEMKSLLSRLKAQLPGWLDCEPVQAGRRRESPCPDAALRSRLRVRSKVYREPHAARLMAEDIPAHPMNDGTDRLYSFAPGLLAPLGLLAFRLGFFLAWAGLALLRDSDSARAWSSRAVRSTSSRSTSTSPAALRAMRHFAL